MDDIEFAGVLKSIPDVKSSVLELFDRSKANSISRTYLAVVDLERFFHKEKSFIGSTIERTLILQQLAYYMARARDLEEEAATDEREEILVRRLQMLSYSQFWESLAIQRLLRALTRIAQGLEYEPRALIEADVDSYFVYKEIRTACRSLDLALGDVLTTLYKNQIRNAFAHSEFYVVADYICFVNYDSTKPHMLPSLKLATWSHLFSEFNTFVGAMFEARQTLIASLMRELPFRVDLIEFPGAFNIDRDSHGYWTFSKTA